MRSTSTGQASTKEEILHHLLTEGGAKAQDLAESLSISPQAIRRHLKDLEDEGAIAHRSVQEGMGRPQHIYELTPQGRDRFPHRYDDFAVSLLDTLTETVGREQVGSILQKQWQRKAIAYREQVGTGSLGDRVSRLVDLRRQEGYMAQWYELEPDNGSGLRYLICEYNCAISNVAESFPSVCGHELEMFAQILPDCRVERTHWQIEGEHQCGYLIVQNSNFKVQS